MPRIARKSNNNIHASCHITISKCMINHRHSRICSRQLNHKFRDREPSRISQKKVMSLLRRRKLRKRHKKMIIKGTPVSSVLYSIATNYNYWKLKYINSYNSLYSSFFRATHKLSVRYNACKQTLLLSGDIELNPEI